MGIFDFLKPKQNTAAVAKDRLRILIQQEHAQRGAPDYLPLLQKELLEVIRKYINVDADAVKVDMHKDGDNDLLDISVALPETRRKSLDDSSDDDSACTGTSRLTMPMRRASRSRSGRLSVVM